ncbi:MAG: hypothetical protein NVV74_25995 [Magnetospirillum sp.]|nr:hypothetical protein [Magnetospirillum sp.]
MRAASIGRRLKHGFLRYFAVAVYLYVCFAAVLAYKAAVLQGVGVHATFFGFAAVKALIIAKFLLVGEELRIGERSAPRTLVIAIFWRSAAVLLLLVGLSAIEKVLEGLVHHQTLAQSFADFGGGTVAEMLATALLLYLVLLPYVAYRCLNEALGRDQLFQLMRTGTTE